MITTQCSTHLLRSDYGLNKMESMLYSSTDKFTHINFNLIHCNENMSCMLEFQSGLWFLLFVGLVFVSYFFLIFLSIMCLVSHTMSLFSFSSVIV